MAGDVGVLAAHLDQVERELDLGGGANGSGSSSSELRQPVGDPSHLPGEPSLSGMSEVGRGAGRRKRPAARAGQWLDPGPRRAAPGELRGLPRPSLLAAPADRAAGRRAAAGRCRVRARSKASATPFATFPAATASARRCATWPSSGSARRRRSWSRPAPRGCDQRADATSASSRRPLPTRADR